MRVMVTGCAGFIGSHVAERLLVGGHEVVGIDCFNDNYPRTVKENNVNLLKSWDRMSFVSADLADGGIGQHLDDLDVVVHLSAEPGVRSSWGRHFHRYVRNNVTAMQVLLEALSARPEVRLVYGSSSSIYGDAERLPTPEDVTPHPVSPYGMSKLAGEHLCSVYSANAGLFTTTLRFFTVYGARQRPDMAFHIFCRAALQGAPVQIYGDGSQTRDFTHVSDVASAIVLACEGSTPAGSTYNVGGGSPASLSDALGVIGDLAGTALCIEHREVVKGDVRDTRADTSAARRDLGFLARVNLRDGLADELAWISESLGSKTTRVPPSV